MLKIKLSVRRLVKVGSLKWNLSIELSEENLSLYVSIKAIVEFAVSYEVTAKILYYNAEKVGPLVDRIGKRSGSTITSMKWKDADV